MDRLSDVLYEVQRLCPGIAVLGVTWIHMQHPIYPIQGEILRFGSSGGSEKGIRRLKSWVKSRVRNVLDFGYCVGSGVLFSLRLVYLHWIFRKEIGAIRRQSFDVVFKTWSFRNTQPDDGGDFYYGDLQKRLEERGVRTLLLCGDTEWRDEVEFVRTHLSQAGLRRLSDYCFIPPYAPLLVIVQQLWAWARLQMVARRQTDRLIRRICVLVRRALLTRGVMLKGVYYWYGRNIAQTWRPRAVVTLYEGRSWERCLWSGVKDAHPDSAIVGYQHANLFPYAVSLLRPEPDEERCPAPDIVLCLGERTRHMMAPGHRACGSELIAFGTFRKTAQAMSQAAPQPSRRTVLILPEGYLDESKLLFDFACQLAVRLPDHRFILRCHPALPFSTVLPLLEHSPDEFANVEVTPNEHIDEDLARSSVAFYRGSSAVLYAVSQGLKPYYFHIHDDHYVDPLFELDVWKERVSGATEAAEKLGHYADLDPVRLLKPWKSAVDYVDAYSIPVTEESIDCFSEVLGLGK